MSLIAWIILGAIAGYVASLIMKTNSEQGLIKDIVMGVLGAIAGGFIVSLFGAPGVSGLNLYSLIVATFGAAVLIWVGRRLA